MQGLVIVRTPFRDLLEKLFGVGHATLLEQHETLLERRMSGLSSGFRRCHRRYPGGRCVRGRAAQRCPNRYAGVGPVSLARFARASGSGMERYALIKFSLAMVPSLTNGFSGADGEIPLTGQGRQKATERRDEPFCVLAMDVMPAIRDRHQPPSRQRLREPLRRVRRENV
jgi:hypothetical protein